jgi:hypothetical protein
MNFYDTHAPQCYFAFALTHLSTAKQIVNGQNPHRFNSLWATSEAGADERFYFPETVGDDFAYDPVLEACYAFLCDDEITDKYEQYAKAICAAALVINQNFSTYFPQETTQFCIVPGDDSFEFLGDDEAIRLSMPQARIAELRSAGYLDRDDSKFGIYPADIYGG